MHDFRVELHAVQAPLRILECRDGRRVRDRDDSRPGRRGRDRVAMRHPDRLLLGQAGEQLRLDGGQVRLAELRRAGPLDRAAEIERQELRSVADAERRNAELEHLGIDVRGTFGVHRGRAAAEDQRVRVARAHLRRRHAVADELRVHAALAHAPRDQLRVLPAEIHHQHRPLLRGPLRQRENFSGDSSVPPS